MEHGFVRYQDYIPPDELVACCPTVVLEVLRGSRDRFRYQIARDLMFNAEMLDAPTPLARFEEAANVYLVCRDAGITPSAADCLIAACAIAHGVPLLHNDHDFDLIANVVPLKILTRS